MSIDLSVCVYVDGQSVLSVYMSACLSVCLFLSQADQSAYDVSLFSSEDKKYQIRSSEPV